SKMKRGRGEGMAMGSTYLFECLKCGYESKVAGGIAEGADILVETIQCDECKDLFDAVVALRVPETEVPRTAAPLFADVFNRLSITVRSRWEHYSLACPVAAEHPIRVWKYPDKC